MRGEFLPAGGGSSDSSSSSSSMAGGGSGGPVGSAAEDGGPPAPERVLFPPTFSVSEIKNKQRRHFMFLRWKQQQRKVGGRARRGGRYRRAGEAPAGRRVWLTDRSPSPARRSWPPRRSGERSEKPWETE